MVCGEVFASPAVTNILSAILTVARPGEGQILLIVKNYTGDRLNFGLAAEIAKSKYGYRVEMVLVDDDCSIENTRKAVGRRGLAGTVLVHKIAGAMAEAGADLDTIYSFCREIFVYRRMATVGFTFKDAGVEGLKDIEIGRGIHGEPGTLKLTAEKDFENIVEIVLRKLYTQIPRRQDRVAKPQVVLLLNNLGGASSFVMATFSHNLLKQMRIEYDIAMILEGTFMTSFNQEGISVTVFDLNDQKQATLTFLRSPVRISANVPFNNERTLAEPDDHPVARYDTEQNLDKIVYDERCYKVKFGDLGIEAGKKALNSIGDLILKCEKSLNTLDAEFGDGDTGSLIAGAAKAIQMALNGDKINFMYPCIVLHDLSEIIQKHMGGSLGAILAIFLEAAAEAFIFEHSAPEDLYQLLDIWLEAIEMGTKAVMRYGLAELGDRTIVDALSVGVDALKNAKASNEPKKLQELIDEFATGCEKGADETKTMLPKSGRAAYAFSDGKEFKPEGNDPGAQAIAIIARALYEGIKPVFNKFNVE